MYIYAYTYTYVYIYYKNMCVHTYAHTLLCDNMQDLIHTLAGVVAYMFIPAKVGIKSCRCARECFICTCVGCMCMFELTITGWWIIVAYLSIPNWFELQLVSQLASYLFSYFSCDPYFLFQIQNFFLYLVLIRLLQLICTVIIGTIEILLVIWLQVSISNTQ